MRHGKAIKYQEYQCADALGLDPDETKHATDLISTRSLYRTVELTESNVRCQSGKSKYTSSLDDIGESSDSLLTSGKEQTEHKLRTSPTRHSKGKLFSVDTPASFLVGHSLRHSTDFQKSS
jgi:hypothetical protein